MNRDKQIEEMANDIDKSHWRIELDFTGCHINSTEIAEALYTAGYRKSSDIAREIFEEIDELLMPFGYQLKTISLQKYIKLKKKYIGEDTNVTTKESEGEG